MKKFASVCSLLPLVLAVVLAGPAEPASAKGVQNNANLVGSAAFPSAKGNARFRAQLGDPTGSLSVAVENGPAGGTVTITVGGASAGTILLNGLGNGTMLTTWPVPVKGLVVAATAADGTLVVSGTFQ